MTHVDNPARVRMGWFHWRFWLGVASTVVFLFLAFSNVQWAELWTVLEAVDWLYLSVASGLLVMNLIVRGFRWQILLAPLGTLTAWDAFAYVNVGYLGNNVLPLRAGEVIRAVLLVLIRRNRTQV